jgi:hypothetical protein
MKTQIRSKKLLWQATAVRIILNKPDKTHQKYRAKNKTIDGSDFKACITLLPIDNGINETRKPL